MAFSSVPVIPLVEIADSLFVVGGLFLHGVHLVLYGRNLIAHVLSSRQRTPDHQRQSSDGGYESQFPDVHNLSLGPSGAKPGPVAQAIDSLVRYEIKQANFTPDAEGTYLDVVDSGSGAFHATDRARCKGKRRARGPPFWEK